MAHILFIVLLIWILLGGCSVKNKCLSDAINRHVYSSKSGNIDDEYVKDSELIKDKVKCNI